MSSNPLENGPLMRIIDATLGIVANHWPANHPIVVTREMVAAGLADQIQQGDAHLAGAFAELGIEVPE